MKNKIAAAEESMTDLSETEETEIPPDEPVKQSGDAVLLTMYASGLDLRDYSGKDELVLAVNTLAESYNTVMLPLVDDNGKLIYYSPALSELVRQPDISSEDEVYSLLSSAASAAKAKNINVCALLIPSIDISSANSAALIDSRLIGELAENGITRIMLKLPIPGDDGNYSRWLQNYIKSLDAGECEIGYALCSSYIADAAGAKLIQALAGSADFLGIYFDKHTGTYDEVSNDIIHELNSLIGMFSVYNINVLIDDDENTAAVYKACTDFGIQSICFTGFVLPDKLLNSESPESDESEPDNKTDTEKTISENTNPYASTADSSETDHDDISDETEAIDNETKVDEETPWF